MDNTNDDFYQRCPGHNHYVVYISLCPSSAAYIFPRYSNTFPCWLWWRSCSSCLLSFTLSFSLIISLFLLSLSVSLVLKCLFFLSLALYFLFFSLSLSLSLYLSLSISLSLSLPLYLSLSPSLATHSWSEEYIMRVFSPIVITSAYFFLVPYVRPLLFLVPIVQPFDLSH